MMAEAWMDVLPPPPPYFSGHPCWLVPDRRGGGPWTLEENKVFEEALAAIDLDAPDSWEKVALMLPRRTVADVVDHYRALENHVGFIEAGLVPFPHYDSSIPSSRFTLGGDNGFRRGYCLKGGQELSLQPLSPRPVHQELFKEDPNQINYSNELRGSDSDVSYHPDGQILSLQALPPPPVVQVLFKQDNSASNSDLQSIPDYETSRRQTLPSPPVQQEVLFKEDKTASSLRFHPYILTPPPRRESTPPFRAPGKVEEGTAYDGTAVKSSNPFAPTESVISSASHHVPSSLESIQHGQSSRPLPIPFHHLEKITDNFSNERILGQGGSGVVYKGVLQNGETIAVKKIMSSLMPDLQKKFENEVYHLMMLKHPNIVRCVGYCYETRNECVEYNGKLVFAEIAERLLCLEYIPNRSLDKYITDESSGLDWSTRYKIIEGICYGLCHLHEENGKPIIHLDLKPANILLADGMVSKITDFGLSRLLDQQTTIYTKSRDGTLGYMAPEFLHGGTITPKSDIFSLGVIIIEVVTGNRDYPDVTRTSSDGYINLVLNKWRNVLEKSSWSESLERDCQQIERCIQVGLICVNPDRTKRPPIAKIINMLQGSENINCDTSIETK